MESESWIVFWLRAIKVTFFQAEIVKETNLRSTSDREKTIAFGILCIVSGFVVQYAALNLFGIGIENRLFFEYGVIEILNIAFTVLLQAVFCWIFVYRASNYSERQGTSFVADFVHIACFSMPAYLLAKLATVALDYAFIDGAFRSAQTSLESCATHSWKCVLDAEQVNSSFVALSIFVIIIGNIWQNTLLSYFLKLKLGGSITALWLVLISISIGYVFAAHSLQQYILR